MVLAKGLGFMGVVGAALLLCGIALCAPASASGFSAALRAGSTSFSSGTLQLEGTTGSSNCYSTGSGSGGAVTSNSSICSTGSPLPAGSLSTGSSNASTTLTSRGTANASSALVASGACGVAQFVDPAGSDDALPFNGVTYGASGPLGTTAAGFDGSTGWAETTNSDSNPEGFSVLLWFKTTTAAGGLLGFSSQANPTTSTPTDHDRQLWIDPSGKLVWGVYSTNINQLTSPSAVNTGNWVFAVASIGSSGTALYVNGTKVASSSTPTTAQNYTGWWSLGYASMANWNDTPSTYYFNGSLAQAAVIPSQLSASQVSNLYGDTTLASYRAGVNALNPTNYWPLNDLGTTPYEGSIPGVAASTTLVDASVNANSGTAQGGVTLGSSGPAGFPSALALNGSTGYVQTTNSYSNPEGISVVAWFNSSATTGGTILGFTSSQGTTAPSSSDRLLWLDKSGKLVWGVKNGTASEITSPTAYNDGAWHMVVAEIGSSGQQLWIDGTEVASTTSVTSAGNYTGYWHLGWGYETGWSDAPTSAYLNGSIAEAAVIPSQLSTAQISTLDGAASAAVLALDVGQLAPSAYWPLQDSASNICGTVEVTVQQTVGSTTSCLYPAGSGSCGSPSSTYLLPAFGVLTMTAPTSGTPATVKITMAESASSGTTVAGLHMLPDIGFGTARSPSAWTAQLAYAPASVEL